MTDPGLFDPTPPADPDETIAREEIDAYFDDLMRDAQEALAKAQADADEVQRLRAAWTERGEIIRDPLRDIDLRASSIVARTMDGRHRTALASIENRGDRELRRAAETARTRDEALRRWLTARGHGLGALALPASDEKKRGGRRG